MESHELANLLPMMTPEELAELATDIKANGQREPIYTFEGKILDGRNRYKACELAGVTPVLVEWSGSGSLLGFVVSANVKRRHLTATQRAIVAEKLEPLFAQEAKQNQKHHGGTAPGRKKSVTEISPGVTKGEARNMAAKAAGTNGRYVSNVKAIRGVAPDLLPLMRDGKLSMEEAKRVAKLPAADLSVVVKEMDAGATLRQAAAKVEGNSLATPRTLASASGQPVPDQKHVDEVMLEVSGFSDAVKRIAVCAVPPTEMRVKLRELQLEDDFNRALPGASSVLSQFETSTEPLIGSAPVELVASNSIASMQRLPTRERLYEAIQAVATISSNAGKVTPSEITQISGMKWRLFRAMCVGVPWLTIKRAQTPGAWVFSIDRDQQERCVGRVIHVSVTSWKP